MSIALERMALHKCLRDRLATLAEGLSAGRTDWSDMRIAVPPGEKDELAFDRIYRVPSRTLVSTVYDGSIGSGALDALPLSRAAELAQTYATLDQFSDLSDEEQRLATEVGTLGFNRTLSDIQRDHLLSVLTRLDYVNALTVIIAEQRIQGCLELYPLTSKEIDEIRKQMPAVLTAMREKYGNCVYQEAFRAIDPRLL